MKIFKTKIMIALTIFSMVSCVEESVVPTLPEFEIVNFVEGDDCYDVEISYVSIKNADKNESLATIDSMNYVNTFQEYALDPMDIETSARMLIDEYAAAGHVYETIGGEYYYYTSVQQEAKLVRNDTILCYETYIESMAGGAHGVFSLMYDCYDIATGQMYDFNYLFEGEWSSAMRRLVYEKLMSLEDCTIFETSPEMLLLPESISITETGLLMAYQPYDVALQADGIVSIELSDEEIAATGAPLLW